jgi:hypothetical protein
MDDLHATAMRAGGGMTVELLLDHLTSPYELNGMIGVEFSERLERTRHWRLGRVVAPHRVQRDPRQWSGFLRLDRLSARVIAAFGANPMRTLHGPALGAFLENDGGRLLVRVARALLSL